MLGGVWRAFSWRDVDGSHRLMLSIVAALGALNLVWGEHAQAGGGLGWDGVLYAEMVRNLGTMVSDGLLSTYYAQRIFPSAVVRGLLLLSGTPITDASIIRGFELYNLALLLGACWAWRRLSNELSLSLGGRWLGFGALFLNFQCAKQIFYCPVLTDATAFFLGLLLLLFYVEKKPFALLAVALVGAFAWQVAGIYGALLLLFLKAEIPRQALALSPAVDSERVARAAKAGWLGLLGVSLAGFFLLGGLEKVVGAEGSRAWHLERLRQLVTALPSLAAVAGALMVLGGSFAFLRRSLNVALKPSLLLVAASLAAAFLPWCGARVMANAALANPGSFAATLRLCFLPPAGKFLLPLVALAVFWGPMVLVLLLRWAAFCQEARKLGPGFVAVAGLSLPLVLVTEPRFITCAWPFFVCGAVLALEHAVRRPSFDRLFLLITVLFAQFWLRVNVAPWPAGDYEGLTAFPKQLFFMHFGLWMGWWPYVIQFALIALCVVCMRRTLRSAAMSGPLGEAGCF